jgi:hypothetical protein
MCEEGVFLMTEEYGHIPDGFFLSEKEIEDLRNSKKELTDYGRKKLRELLEKQKKEDT